MAPIEGEIALTLALEALIWTEPVVGISNEVRVFTGIRAINTQIARFSTLFTCLEGINHFEVIGTRIFEFLVEKINLGCEHIHVFKLVDLLGEGLSALIIPALVGGYLLNESTSYLDTQRKECRSYCGINMFPG